MPPNHYRTCRPPPRGWRADQGRWQIRGHGDAADLGPGEPRDWEPFAAEVAAAARGLRTRSGGRLVLVGHSLGATSGLLAEARCPGLFWRMFCFEPVAFDPARQAEGEAATQFLSRNAARRRAEFGSVEEARRRLASKPPFGGPGGVTPRALRDIARHSLREVGDGSGRLRLKCSPAEESQTYIAGARSNILQGENRRSLARVKCPVVIAAGSGAAKSSTSPTARSPGARAGRPSTAPSSSMPGPAALTSPTVSIGQGCPSPARRRR